jgi:2-dehydro-3-deoxygluconokinase
MLSRPVFARVFSRACRPVMTKVVAIGECMIELSERADGTLVRSWGGDTLNTAIYLARLGVDVDYATALGDDAWSDEMVAAWRSEGVGTDLVQRLPGRLPGLYMIQTDARGERRFSYWRDHSPARTLFDREPAAPLRDALMGCDLIYVSGITLSLYGVEGRRRLFESLGAARSRGVRIAFDTNFRPRGWPDLDEARNAYRKAFGAADIIIASQEDLALLFGPGGRGEVEIYMPETEIVLKLAEPACLVYSGPRSFRVTAPPVADIVDTTAAGDSFAAAYLAARLAGLTPERAAEAGHRLAGEVIRHHGAIIARSAMPENIL